MAMLKLLCESYLFRVVTIWSQSTNLSLWNFAQRWHDVGVLQENHYSCVVFFEESAGKGASNGEQGGFRAMV